MTTFFSASLLTFVVVASIAAVGWLQGRSGAPKHSKDKKKEDGEDVPCGSIDIIVDDNSAKRSSRQSSAPSPSQKVEGIMPQRVFDMMNRRQYVKAVCDRFESRGRKSSDGDSSNNNNAEDLEMGSARPTIARTGDTGITGAGSVAIAAIRAKAKAPNNLSSFVRQCVANIERANCGFGSTATQPSVSSSPRASLISNQCDSPPKQRGIEERRLPSLVAATDYYASALKEQSPVEEETPIRPIFRRVPSFPSSKPPLPAPFELSKMTLPTSSTTDLQVRQETEAVDVPIMPATASAMPPRKMSNASARLQQFQQLVPSNQARLGQ